VTADENEIGVGLGDAGAIVDADLGDLPLMRARGLAFLRSWISCARS
jgi:hypothetical protein